MCYIKVSWKERYFSEKWIIFYDNIVVFMLFSFSFSTSTDSRGLNKDFCSISSNFHILFKACSFSSLFLFTFTLSNRIVKSESLYELITRPPYFTHKFIDTYSEICCTSSIIVDGSELHNCKTCSVRLLNDSDLFKHWEHCTNELFWLIVNDWRHSSQSFWDIIIDTKEYKFTFVFDNNENKWFIYNTEMYWKRTQKEIKYVWLIRHRVITMKKPRWSAIYFD